MRVAASIFILCLALPALAAEMSFLKRGQKVATLSLEELLKKVPGKTVEVWEPHEKRMKKYTGIPFRELLVAVYGADWKAQEEVLFTCRDGYQPSVPSSEFAKKPSYLAYESPGSPFLMDNPGQNQKQIDLGPFYLVWQTEKEDDAVHWPYQVIAVDLIQFQDKFPQMAPSPKSAPAVQRGYMAFRKNCMQCHRVNGEGGVKGIELNYPASVTEYFKPRWLEKVILDPASVRFGTTMPALGAKDPKKTTADIVAYLKAMAKQKKKPKEEKDHD